MVSNFRKLRSWMIGKAPALFFLLVSCAMTAPTIAADALLMTLQLDSNTVRWRDEFVLSLEIYGAPSASPPEVTIDGLDQFQLQGQGKNLLQVPGGKTVKWILTYTLLAHQNGNFKLGPAKSPMGGKMYSSNTVFLAVEGTPRSKPAQVLKPPVVAPPLVHSAREVGDRVLLLLDAANPNPYRGEGFTVTLKLLSQLPVENLRFLEEAEFPGFLKYDFPYTDSPRGEHATYKGESYASFDLQKFLVFPLQDGDAFLPPFRCEVTVRVPSSTFALADPRFDLERASNPLRVKVQRLPEPADIVGNFHLRRETISNEPRSKTVQLSIEGLGLLSTFAFPENAGKGYRARPISTSTESSLLGQVLKSRTVTQVEILADDNTTEIVLPEYTITQFNPWKREASRLELPAMALSFTPQVLEKPVPPQFPETTDPLVPIALLGAACAIAAALFALLRPKRRVRAPSLSSLLRRKKPHLQIPKIAAKGLYQQIAQHIALRDSGEESLIQTLRLHLPETEWEVMEDRLKRLEWTAFSQARGQGLTYEELRDALSRMEKRWLP